MKRERTRSPVKGRKHFATQTDSTIDEIMQHYGKENHDGGCDDFRMLSEDECRTEINVSPIDYDNDSGNIEVMDTVILATVDDDPRSRNETIVQEFAESIWNDSKKIAMEQFLKRQEILSF